MVQYVATMAVIQHGCPLRADWTGFPGLWIRNGLTDGARGAVLQRNPRGPFDGQKPQTRDLKLSGLTPAVRLQPEERRDSDRYSSLQRCEGENNRRIFTFVLYMSASVVCKAAHTKQQRLFLEFKPSIVAFTVIIIKKQSLIVFIFWHL